MTVARRPGGSQRIPEPRAREDAGDPVWQGCDASFALARILPGLDRHQARLAGSPQPRHDERMSAVLVALADGANGAEVLLTTRASTLASHTGEVSFPGGRVDGGEDVVSAARREAFEEVGLRPHDTVFHGHLAPVSTLVSKSFIVPVVVSTSRDRELTLHAPEVDRAFWVPLRDLVRADTFHWEWWSFDGSTVPDRPMFFFHLDDETIWGATARILHELLCVVHGVEHPVRRDQGPPASRTAR